MSGPTHEVAVIGAGPYGLSTVAHLRAVGVAATVFGDAMASWEHAMPRGMLLRSTRRSSSIADPGRELTLDDFAAAHGTVLAEPLPVETFVAYGRWFQEQVAPDLDRRHVTRLTHANERFRLALRDGEEVAAARVVIATGFASYPHRPPELADLRPPLCIHSSELVDPARYAGTRVLVVGGGQSALESAALLHEAGASVEVVVRARQVRWIPAPPPRRGGLSDLLHELMYPPTEVGPPGINWVAAAPDVFRRLPAEVRGEIFRRCTVPVGATWLRGRLVDVPITMRRSVARAVPQGSHVAVVLDDGGRLEVDHVLAATGYRVAISHHAILAPDLRRAVRVAGGYPRLHAGFESSVPGLHFVGAAAAHDFGPVMRFVAGTWFSAPALTRAVRGRPPAPLRFSW